MIDTPGFDDSEVSDTEILTRIAFWMSDSYDDNELLSGLIYLHPISDNRMSGGSKKNLRMFRKLCGDENLGNVMLGTTMWENTPEADGELREKQLKENYWKEMIDHGSTVARISRNSDDASRLVRRLLKQKKKDTILPKLQKEFGKERKTLGQTEVGKFIQEDIEKFKRKLEEQQAQWKKDMEEALKKSKFSALSSLSMILMYSKAISKRYQTSRPSLRRSRIK